MNSLLPHVFIIMFYNIATGFDVRWQKAHEETYFEKISLAFLSIFFHVRRTIVKILLCKALATEIYSLK